MMDAPLPSNIQHPKSNIQNQCPSPPIDPIAARALLAQEERLSDLAAGLIDQGELSPDFAAEVIECRDAIILANELAWAHESDHPADRTLHAAAIQLKLGHLARLDSLTTIDDEDEAAMPNPTKAKSRRIDLKPGQHRTQLELACYCDCTKQAIAYMEREAIIKLRKELRRRYGILSTNR